MDTEDSRNRISELVTQHIIQAGITPQQFNSMSIAQKRNLEMEKMRAIEQRRQELIDEDLRHQAMKEMFDYEERTEHKGILPAKDRILNYKTKAIKRQAFEALPPKSSLHSRYHLVTAKSLSTLGGGPPPKKVADRPTTAGVVSMFGNSD